MLMIGEYYFLLVLDHAQKMSCIEPSLSMKHLREGYVSLTPLAPKAANNIPHMGQYVARNIA